MIRITREKFSCYAKHFTPEFESEALAIATRGVGDELEFDPRALGELRAKHAKPPRRGLGDLVEKAVKPVAKALQLPCLDPQTGQLKPESGCAKRRAALNRILPDVTHPLS